MTRLSSGKSKIFFILILAIFVLAGFGVLAIGDEVFAATTAEQCKKCTDSGNICLQTALPAPIGYCVKGFPEYLGALYNLFIGIVGILAVIMIMAGGFQWLLAAGNAQRISGAKTTIISAIMGLVLALMSYTILGLINPQLLTLKLKVEPVESFLLAPEATSTAFCKLDVKFKPVQNEKGPLCGIKYELEDGSACWGASCGAKDLVCVQESSSIEGEIKAGCSNNVTIQDKQDFGYGVGQWGLAMLIDDRRYCGELFYKSPMKLLGAEISGEQKAIGIYCLDFKSRCVISPVDDVTFTKKASEASSWSMEKVGEFNKRTCY